MPVLTDKDLEELYDMTPESDNWGLPQLNNNLSKEEMEEAEYYYQLKQGNILIIGEAGSGKETFMMHLLAKLRRLFKDFRVMLDRKPRLAFGSYIPFNIEVLTDEYDRLYEKTIEGKKHTKLDFARYKNAYQKKKINNIIDQWWDINKGDLFYNCGIGLSELRSYFYNRRPHNIMNYTISPMFDRFRHYKRLIVGTAIDPHELDRISYLPKVTHLVECSQTNIEGLHHYTIYKGRVFTEGGIRNIASPPEHTTIDGLKPLKWLGGKCVYDLFNSLEREEPTLKARR